MTQIENLVLYGIQSKNEMFWDFLLDLKSLQKLYIRSTPLPNNFNDNKF